MAVRRSAVPFERTSKGGVPAIGIAQAARGVLIIAEEKRRVPSLVGALEKRLIHGFEKLWQILRCDGALAAHVRL